MNFPRAVLRTARRYTQAIARRAIVQLRIINKSGPRGVIEFIRLRPDPADRAHIFAQGVRTTIPVREAQRWKLGHNTPLVVAVVGTAVADADEFVLWLRQVAGDLNAHFLVSPAIASHLSDVDPDLYSVISSIADTETTSFFDIKDWVGKHGRLHDLSVVDLAHPLVPSIDLLRLQHAAHTYAAERSEIGFVVPALRTPDGAVIGYEWDRRSEAFQGEII